MIRLVSQLLLMTIMLLLLLLINVNNTTYNITEPILLDSVIVTKPPDLRGDLYVFMGAVAQRESNNTLAVVNRYGYLGKYQFSPKTLWALGTRFEVTKAQFLGSEALQDNAMIKYLQDNRTSIEDIIVRFDGRWFRGIYITESGLLAGAHLVGAQGLRAYFDPTYTITRKGRRIRPRTIDGNGVGVERYISQFSGYDLELDISN